MPPVTVGRCAPCMRLFVTCAARRRPRQRGGAAFRSPYQSRRLLDVLLRPPPPTEQLTSSNLEAHQSMTNEELQEVAVVDERSGVIDVEEDLRACGF